MQDSQFWPVERLDLEKEWGLILSSLRDTGRQVEVYCCHATLDNLSKLIALGYNALHFSGHGKQDSLVFEDECGLSVDAGVQTLHDLLTAGGSCKLKLVCVSSCYSEGVAHVLVKAGVQHVVAVQLNQPILDAAAIKFNQHFYLSLAAGNTIRFSFDRAVANVRQQVQEGQSQAVKFRLLPEETGHTSTPFDEAPVGKLLNRTPELPVRRIQHLPEAIFGRERDIVRVLQKLRKRRIVTIAGGAGVGKTAVAAAVCDYSNKRRHFSEGVYLVSLRGVTDCLSAIRLIAECFSIPTPGEVNLLETLSHSRCLIALDNIDDLLSADRKLTCQLLSRLLSSAPHIRLLVSSRTNIGAGIAGFDEGVVELAPLSLIDSCKMFMWFASGHLDYSELNASNEETALYALLEHELILSFAGLPLAIILCASQLEFRSLYEMTTSFKQLGAKAIKDPLLTEEELDATSSLALAMNSSFELLRNRSSELIELLGVIGLVPNGLSSADLKYLWGDTWRETITPLLTIRCLDKQVDMMDYYISHPIVADYAVRQLDNDRRKEYVSRLFSWQTHGLFEAGHLAINGNGGAFLHILYRCILNGMHLITQLAASHSEREREVELQIGQFANMACDVSCTAAIPEIANIVIQSIKRLADKWDSEILRGFLQFADSSLAFHVRGDLTEQLELWRSGWEMLDKAEVPLMMIHQYPAFKIGSEGAFEMPDEVYEMIQINSESSWIKDLQNDVESKYIVAASIRIQSMAERLLLNGSPMEAFLLYAIVFHFRSSSGHLAQALVMIDNMASCMKSMQSLGFYASCLGLGAELESSLPTPRRDFEKRLTALCQFLRDNGNEIESSAVKMQSWDIIDNILFDAKKSDVRLPLVFAAFRAAECLNVSVEFKSIKGQLS